MKTLILGNGFVSKKLIDYYLDVAVYGNQPSDPIQFNSSDKKTWDNLPKNADLCIITFKLTNLKETQQLFFKKLQYYKQIICLSSTKTYNISYPEQIIDETCSRNSSQIRVICENFLLNQGAMIICLSLIYGENRSLKKWLDTGKIKNGNKLINLIHINDLCHCISKLSEKPLNEIINISDGEKRYWQNIANLYQISLPKKVLAKTSKFIPNTKLLKLIKYKFEEIN